MRNIVPAVRAKRTQKLISATIALVVIVCAGHAIANEADRQMAPLLTGLGGYTFPVSNCTSQAQQYFDQGLRLYYGFRFPESMVSFREAARLDSNCPMTHWGEALAIAPNPNSRYLRFPDDPTAAGAAAIKRAMSLLDRASDQERGLIRALHTLYDASNKPGREQRDQAYANALKMLSTEHPDNAEIQTLYAEALMKKSAWDYWTPDGKPRPGTFAAMTALQSVIDQDLNHPGANHLLIHILEDSQNPETALDSAERLAATMPMVGHMVHMPSHIYIRTGLYAQAIESNQLSIEADRAFIEQWGDHAVPLGITSLSSNVKLKDPHPADFIHMAAVLQGNYALSTKIAETLANMSEPNLALSGGFQRRYVRPMLTYRRYADWRKILKLPAPDPTYPFVTAIWHFVRGSALTAQGQLADADRELVALNAIAAGIEMKDFRTWVNSGRTLLNIASHVLSAELAVKNEDFRQAIFHLEAGVRLEDGLNYMEPPSWGHPVRHELGALLLALGRAAEAETVFWEDLRRNPENGWALHGVWQSLVQQVKPARADELGVRFKRAWRDADIALENGRAMMP
jgi:tetratricopeptide (TPR) repeat protein